MLNLDELIERPAIQKARERVEALTSLPVNFRHVSQWKPSDPEHPHKLPGPAMHPTDIAFNVYLDETLPEQMAVHELLHVVMIEEGYPDIRFDGARAPTGSRYQRSFEAFADGLVNKFQHPEIYRRMEQEYGQDMRTYQVHVSSQLASGSALDVANGPLSFPLGKQTAIVDILDQLYLSPGSSPFIARYRTASPDTVAAAEALQLEFDQTGFATPEDALHNLKLFVEHEIRFGKAIGVGRDNDLWLALEWFLPNA